MPYFDRLISESGLGFPNRDGAAPALPAIAGDATGDRLDVEQVVEVSDAPAVAPLMRKAASSTIPSPPSAKASAAPASSISAASEPPFVMNPQPPHATEVPPTFPPDRDIPALEPESETIVVERTPEERILETIAAVRAWTSMPTTPPQAIAPLERELLVEAPSPRPTVEASETDSELEPAFVSIRPAMQQPRPLPADVEPRLPAPSRMQQPEFAAEPEVVTVSLSIGSIELVVDAEGAGAAAHREPPPLQHVREPDSAARLRRHYIRERI